MNILKYDVNGFKEITTEAANSERRMMFLSGTIDSEMIQSLVEQIMYYKCEDPLKPIKLFINSNGGSITAGMLLYDVIQGAKIPIEMYCLEKAYSMAAVLFCSGQYGRYILPHSKVMIHDPRINDGFCGNTASISDLSKEMIKLKKDIDQIISTHTKQPLSTIERLTKKDSYFNAEEAVKFGLADGIRSFADMLTI